MKIDTNLQPTSKVTAAALAGAGVTILAWSLQTFFHLTLPPGIESALTTITMFLVAYFKIDE